MTCRREFWVNSLNSLRVIHTYFQEITGHDFGEFRSMIFDKIQFESCDHKGPLEPMYYNCGIPAGVWVCKTCHENVS